MPRQTYWAYIKQQWGYGKAEALLAKDHPKRFHHSIIKWQGSVYDGAPTVLTSQSIIYQGWAGLAPFQPILYGSSPRYETKTITGSFLSKSYGIIRALARYINGLPLQFPNYAQPKFQEPPSESAYLISLWHASHTDRHTLIHFFLSIEWQLIEHPYWDLSLNNNQLKFALEQPNEHGQMLHLSLAYHDNILLQKLNKMGWMQESR